MDNPLVFRKFAEVLAKGAGEILQSERDKFKIVTYKDIQDISTSADLASEKFIVQEIQKKYPSHAIFSEEAGDVKTESDYKWIIDPLDGTKSFVRGIPLYNVSICLEYKGKSIVGVVYLPMTDQLYSAELGRGSTLNGAKITVSNEQLINKSFVGFYTPTKNRENINYEVGWARLKCISDNCYRFHGLRKEVLKLMLILRIHTIIMIW